MLRIEKESDGHTTTLQLSGRIQSANIGDIQAQMDDGHVRLFMDLGEVTRVDVEVVRFLSECEDGGHCIGSLPTLCSRVDSSRASRRGIATRSEWFLIRSCRSRD
jgi:hypothetical protein